MSRYQNLVADCRADRDLDTLSRSHQVQCLLVLVKAKDMRDLQQRVSVELGFDRMGSDGPSHRS